MTDLRQRIGGLALSVVLVAVSAPAQARLQGRVVEFGRTDGPAGQHGPRIGRGNGLPPTRLTFGTRYLDHASVIEARLCRSFGITVRLSTTGSEAMPSRIDVRLIHPRFTRPDGAVSETDELSGEVHDGQTSVGFTFDSEWQMQPGRWRVLILSRGAELASKDFEIVLPPPGSPRSACGRDAEG